jgi:cell division protein YceG involved in septum cleavage
LSWGLECYYRGRGAGCADPDLIQAFMRTFKLILLVVILAFVTAIVGASWFTARHLPMRSDPTGFSVPPGASLRTAAQAIEAAGIDLPAWQLELLGRVLGRSTKIKAGSYEVEEGLTALMLLDKLTRGDVTQGELGGAEDEDFEGEQGEEDHGAPGRAAIEVAAAAQTAP